MRALLDAGLACNLGEKALVTLLLRFGATANRPAGGGVSAMEEATFRADLELLELLRAVRWLVAAAGRR